jgi:hypothetical protein
MEIEPKIEPKIDPKIDPKISPKIDPKLHNLYISEDGNMPRITQIFILEIYGEVAIALVRQMNGN